MLETNTTADTVIVLDFETTGLSPDYGDRAIEIGAVKIVDGQFVDSFQQLMYPDQLISPFIENYTGITNRMLKKASSCAEVMRDFSDYINGFNLVAHNASFDARFLDAEMTRIKRKRQGNFACSMLISRRMYPNAPNHKLGTLVKYRQLPNRGEFHRALADAEMTAHLWLSLINEIKDNHGFEVIPFDVMQKLSRVSKNMASNFLDKQVKNNTYTCA